MKIVNELLKIFADWTKLKIQIHISNVKNFPKERRIWWASIGQNIGVETNGKNEKFERSVLVIKRYNKDASLILPISSKIKEGRPFHKFTNNKGEQNMVNLSQLRSISNKRFVREIGKISQEDFRAIKENLINFI